MEHVDDHVGAPALGRAGCGLHFLRLGFWLVHSSRGRLLRRAHQALQAIPATAPASATTMTKTSTWGWACGWWPGWAPTAPATVNRESRREARCIAFPSLDVKKSAASNVVPRRELPVRYRPPLSKLSS